MDKLTRFVECYINTQTCNLRCHYCYITQRRLFNSKLLKLTHTKDEVKKAFSKERLGGCCLINLCAGGETLIADEVIDVARAFLENGHYVMIVTNGTLTKQLKKFCDFPENMQKHLFFKFSFHYLEFKRLNLLESFAKNVNMIANTGCSYTIEITPSDELIPYIDEIKEFSINNFGALPHITIARDDRTDSINHLSNLTWEEYKKTWATFDSELFRTKTQIFYTKRKEFCYAGEYSINVELESGKITQCYCGKVLGNIYDLEKPINFQAIGCFCSLAHCYNGHAFLTLGNIPELELKTYFELRNRKTKDGKNWVKSEMKNIFSQKLYNNNKEYSEDKKRFVEIDNKLASLQEENSCLKNQNYELLNKINEISNEKQNIQNENETILNSASYKITKPLRFVKKVAKKILRRK